MLMERLLETLEVPLKLIWSIDVVLNWLSNRSNDARENQLRSKPRVCMRLKTQIFEIVLFFFGRFSATVEKF
jgi:hypothetical protein